MTLRRVQAVAVFGFMAAGLDAQTPRLLIEGAGTIEQPDAGRTRNELSQLLSRYPPALRQVLGLDPTLLTNQTYLAPYPALGSFLTQHPEVARSPSFYVPGYFDRNNRGGEQSTPRRNENVRDMLTNLSIFAGFGMAIGLLTWLIRTLIDYRRWSRLSKIQTEVHTKLLDRFTNNDDLRAYIQSAAGSRFLQSTPILLDAGPRSMSAPLGRILWSLQAGLVLGAAGMGLNLAAGRLLDETSQAFHVLGIVGMTVGAGFIASAAFSFVISQRLGLIEHAKPELARENPEAQD